MNWLYFKIIIMVYCIQQLDAGLYIKHGFRGQVHRQHFQKVHFSRGGILIIGSSLKTN